MTKTSTLLAAALLMLPGAVTAQQTQRFTADKHNEYGLVYTLPVTGLNITVEAVKTIETAGPYRQYARQCLGTDRAVAQDRVSWDITSVKVTPYGIPNPEERFLMQLRPGATSYITADENGMILAVNADVEAPAAPQTGTTVTESNAETFNPDEYLQYVNEDFLGSQSPLKRAQMLAEDILEVRDAKVALTRGTADNQPSDGRQLELMLQSLRHQEETMTRAFTGDVRTESVSASFNYLPADEGRSVLTRISDYDGFTEADDYAGEPLYITLKITQEGEMPIDEKGVEKKLPKDALIYNIPGRGEITLTWRGKTIYTGEFEMSQYGVRFGLNPSLFSDKKSPSYATFNPATGAIDKIGPVSDLQ